jgi:hypothetical protein
LPPHQPAEFLGDKTYVTVILRLLLGRHGQLEHGEVVDIDGTSQGRFKGWRGLTSTLRRWAASQHAEVNADPPTAEGD